MNGCTPPYSIHHINLINSVRRILRRSSRIPHFSRFFAKRLFLQTTVVRAVVAPRAGDRPTRTVCVYQRRTDIYLSIHTRRRGVSRYGVYFCSSNVRKPQMEQTQQCEYYSDVASNVDTVPRLSHSGSNVVRTVTNFRILGAYGFFVLFRPIARSRTTFKMRLFSIALCASRDEYVSKKKRLRFGGFEKNDIRSG